MQDLDLGDPRTRLINISVSLFIDILITMPVLNDILSNRSTLSLISCYDLLQGAVFFKYCTGVFYTIVRHDSQSRPKTWEHICQSTLEQYISLYESVKAMMNNCYLVKIPV